MPVSGITSFLRQIYDEDGPVVADAFYEALFRGAMASRMCDQI